jgi:DNA-binding LytR/AlgR family response regulator
MKPKARLLIVEDEFITMDLLRDYLVQSGYEISGDAMSAEEAMDVLERSSTDLVILDINLKGEKDGIWVAEQIREHYHIPFIFLSAYSDTPTIKRAAATNPYGYLVKPFTKANVYSAVEIALKNFEKEKMPLDLAIEDWANETELSINQSIFVKDNNLFKKIELSQIRYIQAYKNYLELQMEREKVIIRSTLSKFYQVLPEVYFQQVHRSFVVNLQHVDSLMSTSLIIGLSTVPISKNFKANLLKKLNFFES